jgi:hypothetical protein
VKVKLLDPLPGVAVAGVNVPPCPPSDIVIVCEPLNVADPPPLVLLVHVNVVDALLT